MFDDNDQTIRNDANQRNEVVSYDSDRTLRGPVSAPKRPKTGDVILGQYEVLGELGQGGMGVVYRCFDRVGRIEVAVKSLPPELAHDAVEMEEVRRNFSLVASLVHQNIAAYRTLAEDKATGECYLVMEYVQGETLKSHLCKHGGKLSLEETLPILRQVADALDFAHAKKVMHRDIKPGNIMLCPDGQVKVLDFGLAAQIRSSMSRVSMAYSGNSGTRQYKAPEQWEGRYQGAYTDQYALAVTAYELLSGNVPFEDDNASVLREIVLNARMQPVEGLPTYANRALEKGLAKQHDARFANCVDFIHALGGMRSSSSGTGSFIKTVLALLVILGIGMAIAGFYHKQQVAQQRRKVEEQQKAAEKAADAAQKTAAEKAAAEKTAKDTAKKASSANVKAEMTEKEANLDQLLRTQVSLERIRKTFDDLKIDRGQGFGKKLDEFGENCDAGDNAMKYKLYSSAVKLYEEASEAQKWINGNLRLREEASEAQKSAKSARERIQEEYARKWAAELFIKAEQDWENGGECFEKAEFVKAKEHFKSAKEHYGTSESTAKKAHLASLVSSAEAAAKIGSVQQWQNVLDMLVPKMESLDKDVAHQWRYKAEAHLKPSLLLRATVDGQYVEASVEGETKGHPLEWKNLETGSKFKRKITYRQGNTTYVGNLDIKIVDWKGQKTETIELNKQNFNEMVILLGNVQLKLIKVEAGSFMMGSSVNDSERYNDEIQHPVHITKDFWLGETEVTQEQYQAVMFENPSKFQNSRHPVEGVDWHKAMKFCRELTNLERKKGRLPDGYEYTLPTEAQWEYAARGGNKSKGYKYSGSDNLNTVGWYGENSGNSTHPVGEKHSNELGFYDMSGNVWEWCKDSCEWNGVVLTPTYRDGIYDPISSSGSRRVDRGGGCYDYAWSCRVTLRFALIPRDRYSDLGFRVALVRIKSEDHTYKVKKGDNLAHIAYMFNVRTEELASVNNIGNNATLREGSILKLPENALETPREHPSIKKRLQQQPASKSSTSREIIPPPGEIDFPKNERKSEVLVYPKKVTNAKTKALLLTGNYVHSRLLADLTQYYSKQPILLLAPTVDGTYDLFYLPTGNSAQKVNVDNFMDIVIYINPERIFVLGGDDFIPRKFIDMVRSKYSVTILQSDDWERNAANLAKMLKVGKLETSFKSYKNSLEAVNNKNHN